MNNTKQSWPDAPKVADALIAAELNKLSMKEREQVFYDIHGVSEVPDEETTFIEKNLAQLDEEIAFLVAHDKASTVVYDQAARQDSNFVWDRKLRLTFLRCENFDPKRSAQRLIKFFDEKLKLFGPEKLTKTITLEDLGQAGRACLESGILQTLPLRDRAGRAVFLWCTALKLDSTIEDRVRNL